MSRLLLHKVNGSPPARAVMMVGDILGLDFEFREPNIIKGELHSPEYVKKNPMKTIPILEDGDFILTDSHAITTYLITKYGGDKKEILYPSEIKTRATIDQRLHFNNGILFQSLANLISPTLRGKLSGPQPHHLKAIEDTYEVLNLYLKKTKYLALDELTVADICAGATVTTQEKLVPIDGDKYPEAKDWIDGLKKKPYFIQINEPGVNLIYLIVNKLWEKNKKSLNI